MKTQIFLNDYNWREVFIDDATFLYKGFCNRDRFLEIAESLIKKKTNLELSNFVNKLENNFSIIIKRKNEIYVFSDKIKSFPMLCGLNGSRSNGKLDLFTQKVLKPK